MWDSWLEHMEVLARLRHYPFVSCQAHSQQSRPELKCFFNSQPCTDKLLCGTHRHCKAPPPSSHKLMIKELFCQQNVFGSHDLAILRVIREVQDFPRALRLCETTPSSACCREYTFLYFAIFYMFFCLLLERDIFFFSLVTLLYSAGSLSLGMSLKDLLIVPLWARLDCATALLFFFMI